MELCIIWYYQTLRKRRPYLEFFWSVFSRIRSIFPHLVRMRENANQKNFENAHFSLTERRVKGPVTHIW